MKVEKLAIATVMAFGLLACGEKKDSSSANAGKPTELVIWEQMEPSVRDLYLEKIEEFNSSNPDINVKLIHYQNEDLRTQFQNSSLAGQGPDIIYGPNDAAAIFQVSGLIKPVEEIINPELIKTFAKDTLDTGIISGKLYTLPEFNGNNIALLYNKKLVEKAPETFEEFVEIAQANRKIDLGKKDNSIYGFLYNEKEPFWFIGFYNGFGGKVFNDKTEPTLDNSEMVKAFNFVLDIRKKYGLGESGMDYDMASEIFKQGKAAMILNGAWSWAEYTDAGIDLGVSYMPLPEGKKGIFYSASKGYSISENVKEDKKEALNRFFTYIFSPKNNAEISTASSQVPSIILARETEVVKNSPLMNAATIAIKNTTPQPVVAEMRSVWDAMRTNLEAVINRSITPEAAAKKMESDAKEGIKTIKGK
ncbi:MAG: sugar ABC transporter substrate-binding protein [Fusobacteriaceae bacterium]